MPDIESIVKHVQGLEERFLSAEEPTGDKELDAPAETIQATSIELSQDELEDIASGVQGSVWSAHVMLEQMIARADSAQMSRVFGEDAKELLVKASETLEGIASLMDHLMEEVEVGEPNSEEVPEKPEEKKPEEKPEEKKPEEKPEEKK
jgi:hypothetical protein